MKILLIDDSAADRLMFRRTLQSVEGFAHSLAEAEDLASGLAMAGAERFDVVVLDLSLPDSEAADTCGRATSALGDVPVVILTHQDDVELARDALTRGAQDYLVKAKYPPDAMVRLLAHAVEQFRRDWQSTTRTEGLNLILQRLPAVVWTTDASLTFTSSEGGGLRQLGLTPNQVVGMSLEDYFASDPEVCREVVAQHQQALQGDIPAFEVPWRGRLFEVQIAPIHGARGVAGTVGVALDVTDRRRAAAEREAARAVQASLLPGSLPDIPGFDIGGLSIPAQKIGGDWFDYRWVADDVLQVVVGDVSGHDLPATLLACSISARVAAADVQTDLGEVLDSVNSFLLSRAQAEHFVVLMLARLNVARRTLEFASAGDQALIVDRGGRLKRAVHATGMPAGLSADEKYTTTEILPLDPGDIVLLLSDGFRETFSSADRTEMFGNERILEVVSRLRERPAGEMLQGVYDASRAYAAGFPQEDDATGVVIKVRPTPDSRNSSPSG